MKLSLEPTSNIPVITIVADTQGMREALQDIAYGRPGKTDGPVSVNGQRLIDGYHRLVDKILGGGRSIMAVQVHDNDYIVKPFRFVDSRLMGLEHAYEDLDPEGQDRLADLYRI